MELKNIVNDIKLYIDSEAVKNKIALDLGLKFKNNKCLCFNHKEEHESMSYYPKGKYFKCFSCGFKYDIFNHYQQQYNLNFPQAIKSIVSDFGMNIRNVYGENTHKQSEIYQKLLWIISE